jgi:hypothetical protein
MTIQVSTERYLIFRKNLVEGGSLLQRGWETGRERESGQGGRDEKMLNAILKSIPSPGQVPELSFEKHSTRNSVSKA